MSRLLMWDIDLTLLRTGGVTRLAYGAAFSQLTGREPLVYPNFAGRTDLDAAHEIFAAHGIAAVDIADFLARYTAELLARQHLIAQSGTLFPGAWEVLSALGRKRPAIVQTTVTGNVAPVARAKLAAWGLDAALDLSVGAYGSEDVARAPLVAASRRRAEAKYGRFDEVLVIGDTVHDVTAALANGATAIGVASGRTGTDELRAAGAHEVLDSLADVDRAVELLGVSSG
jgi:phosphoglycolate phosphatase-like HAD superfamily hydrolase